MASRMSEASVHKGRVLLTQGAEAERLLVVASGEVRVLLQTAAGGAAGGRGRAGPVLHVSTLGPGSVCGEVGLLSDSVHTASIVSASDVTYFGLLKADLLATADAEVLGQLRAQAESYPPEGALLDQRAIDSHWALYKRRVLRGAIDEQRAIKRRSAKKYDKEGAPRRPPLPLELHS